MVTYGLCQHHVTNARIMVKSGQLNHYEAMRHLRRYMRGASAYTTACTLRESNMYQITYSSERELYDGCYEMMKRGGLLRG